jgi:hypothetical protein
MKRRKLAADTKRERGRRENYYAGRSALRTSTLLDTGINITPTHPRNSNSKKHQEVVRS